jgi:hypothetical protein
MPYQQPVTGLLEEVEGRVSKISRQLGRDAMSEDELKIITEKLAEISQVVTVNSAINERSIKLLDKSVASLNSLMYGKGNTKGLVSILENLETRIEALETKPTVSTSEFHPVQKLVYGAVGVILLAVVSGIVALVVAR